MQDIIIHSNTTAEKSFLCCILLDNSILLYSEVLPDRFYDADNRVIYTEMQKLYTDRKNVDSVTIGSILPDKQEYLFELNTLFFSSSNREVFSQEIKEKYQKRVLDWIKNKIIAGLQSNKSVQDIQAYAKQMLDIVDVSKSWTTSTDVFADIVENLWSTSNIICRYWYEKMDKLFGGYKDWQLVIVGARPWYWKTAFTVELLQRIALQSVKCAIYSLEMTNKEIAQRLISNWASVAMNKIDDHINQDKITESINEKLDRWFEYVTHDNLFKFDDIEASIRRECVLNWCRIVFIDHIWLIRGKIENRNQRLWHVTSTLKTLAKELGITIVGLSQLNRWVEKRGWDEPQLSDLRDSWNIEQDADIVMMIHRETDMDNQINQNEFTLFIRKNRNWQVWSLKMASELRYMRIREL